MPLLRPLDWTVPRCWEPGVHRRAPTPAGSGPSRWHPRRRLSPRPLPRYRSRRFADGHLPDSATDTLSTFSPSNTGAFFHKSASFIPAGSSRNWCSEITFTALNFLHRKKDRWEEKNRTFSIEKKAEKMIIYILSNHNTHLQTN